MNKQEIKNKIRRCIQNRLQQKVGSDILKKFIEDVPYTMNKRDIEDASIAWDKITDDDLIPVSKEDAIKLYRKSRRSSTNPFDGVILVLPEPIEQYVFDYVEKDYSGKLHRVRKTKSTYSDGKQGFTDPETDEWTYVEGVKRGTNRFGGFFAHGESFGYLNGYTPTEVVREIENSESIFMVPEEFMVPGLRRQRIRDRDGATALFDDRQIAEQNYRRYTKLLNERKSQRMANSDVILHGKELFDRFIEDLKTADPDDWRAINKITNSLKTLTDMLDELTEYKDKGTEYSHVREKMEQMVSKIEKMYSEIFG